MSEFVANSPWKIPTEVFRDERNLQCIALVTALSVVLSATGACDTDNLNVIHRTSLWLVICTLVISQVIACQHWFARLIRDKMLLGMAAVSATMVLTTIELHYMKYTPFLPKEPDPPIAFFIFLVPLVAPVAILALALQMRGRGSLQDSIETAPSEIESMAKDSALEAWPTLPVLRVTAQDHYLSIHTQNGTILIRGRMKDALRKLADSHGLQIHRSHWVAESEIVRMSRRGRDYRLHLIGGASLPVSRANVDPLRRRLAAISAHQ